MTRPVLRASAEGETPIQVSWVLTGCKAQWAADVRYIQTSIPTDAVARLMRSPARALAASTVAAEEYRARLAFGLQK